MARKAEWDRYWKERAGPDRPPAPPRTKKKKPQRNWKGTEVGNKSAPYDWEPSAPGEGKASRKSTRRNRLKAFSWPQQRHSFTSEPVRYRG